MIDLDQDAECAPQYVRDILPSPSPRLELRIAVRSIEAWLMADRGAMARYLGIPANNFPQYPDELSNPKQFFIDLIRRKCRRKLLRVDMIPATKSGRSIGPGYVTRIARFVQPLWRPDVAAEHSDSLARCLQALNQWSSAKDEAAG